MLLVWRLCKQGTRAQEVGTQKEESKNQLRWQIFCLCYTSTQLLVGNPTQIRHPPPLSAWATVLSSLILPERGRNSYSDAPSRVTSKRNK